MDKNTQKTCTEQETQDAPISDLERRLKATAERAKSLDPERQKLIMFLFEVFENELSRVVTIQNAEELYRGKNAGGKA